MTKDYLEAHKDEMKDYLEAHKDERNAKMKAYHKAYCKSLKEAYEKSQSDESEAYRKSYYQSHKDKIKAYQKAYYNERYNRDKLFAFKCDIRKMVGKAFTSNLYKKGSRTEQILGCTFEELMKYMKLPKDFFTNRSKYHIDHIVPLATAKTIEDVIRLCHYTNLQILTAEENMAKE